VNELRPHGLDLTSAGTSELVDHAWQSSQVQGERTLWKSCTVLRRSGSGKRTQVARRACGAGCCWCSLGCGGGAGAAAEADGALALLPAHRLSPVMGRVGLPAVLDWGHLGVPLLPPPAAAAAQECSVIIDAGINLVLVLKGNGNSCA
jgi:hypothetical protein